MVDLHGAASRSAQHRIRTTRSCEHVRIGSDGLDVEKIACPGAAAPTWVPGSATCAQPPHALAPRPRGCQDLPHRNGSSRLLILPRAPAELDLGFMDSKQWPWDDEPVAFELGVRASASAPRNEVREEHTGTGTSQIMNRSVDGGRTVTCECIYRGRIRRSSQPSCRRPQPWRSHMAPGINVFDE